MKNNYFIKLGYLLFAACVFFFFCVMLTMVTPYFPYKYSTGFLVTKSDVVLSNKFYIACFYIHITTSFLALGLGVIQFIPKFILKYKKLHRIIGMVYVYSILLLACPSGLELAVNANGGLPAKIGFTLQCIVWFVVTLLAVYKALQKKWLAHIQYMIVSYAITLAAFSLRTESFFMYYFLHTKQNETYVSVTWLSWVGNLLIALLLIELGLAKNIYNRTFAKS